MNSILTTLIINNYFGKLQSLILLLFILLICSCKDDQKNEKMPLKEPETNTVFKYLALGDSYTIGEAVPTEESFPAQLSEKLKRNLGKEVQTKIIATTGWRTDDLITAIESENLESNYDFITLLIGVNNQFQNRNFNQYKKEFVELLSIATKLVGSNKSKLLVLSIPDYAFTPFGKGKVGVSSGIDAYNAFAKEASVERKIDFLNITDISRRGLKEPELVANDDLHISGLVYKEMVERIFNLKFKN